MFQRVMQFLLAAYAAAVAAEISAQSSGAKGADKKADAIAKFQSALNGLVPGWALPVAANCADFLIETAVQFANKNGFFASLVADLNSSPVS